MSVEYTQITFLKPLSQADSGSTSVFSEENSNLPDRNDSVR
jgi:hypothetical protein